MAFLIDAYKGWSAEEAVTPKVCFEKRSSQTCVSLPNRALALGIPVHMTEG